MAEVPSKSKLKSLFSQSKFDEEFIEVAKVELPFIWGRLSLLEEFYAIQMRGGDPERIQGIHSQLGTPKQFHGSPLRKLLHAFTG
jgi:hypothetical protein